MRFSKVRLLAVLCSSTLVGGCAALTPQQEAAIRKTLEPRTVAVSGTRSEAFTAAVRAVAASGLQVASSDRDAGLIQTTRRQTYPDSTTAILLGSQFTRQLVLSITADVGLVSIAPHVEICDRATGGTCHPDIGLRPNEVELVAALASAIDGRASSSAVAAPPSTAARRSPDPAPGTPAVVAGGSRACAHLAPDGVLVNHVQVTAKGCTVSSRDGTARSAPAQELLRLVALDAISDDRAVVEEANSQRGSVECGCLGAPGSR
jgi:hypothetical protein